MHLIFHRQLLFQSILHPPFLLNYINLGKGTFLRVGSYIRRMIDGFRSSSGGFTVTGAGGAVIKGGAGAAGGGAASG